MGIREVKLWDAEWEGQAAKPNELRVIYDTDRGVVHFEIIAKHAGDTPVASSVSVQRFDVAAALRELGVMS